MPMVAPMAQELQAAGHQVAVATGSSLAGELHQLGLPHLTLPRKLSAAQKMADPKLVRRRGLTPEELAKPVTGASFGRMFAGEDALHAAEDILSVTSKFRPDVVVRENAELGGYLFAEKIGVPCVTLDTAATAAVRDPGMLPWLNDSRAAFGLRPVPDISTLTKDPWISWLPQDWYSEQSHSPAHRHYRAADQPTETLDPAIAALPADRPLVLATLGSNTRVFAHGLPLSEIVEALAALPVTAVVALGEHLAPSEWTGPRPDNVHLVSFVQQRLLLSACDLFITHGGFASVRETLTAGVPTVAVPLGQDQPWNAQRLAELGIGVTLTPNEADAATLATACHRVLQNSSYRHAARGFQRQTLGLPGIAELVADLGKLIS
jgi:N-glycosyltransferase